ncbi:hypothetical protein CFP56_034316 [Quercus suber]|uniref:Uncharacterized protein n=1 Tax=Quercus suber TaxID=58331 RepID=A0AAW0JCY3_QUESU
MASITSWKLFGEIGLPIACKRGTQLVSFFICWDIKEVLE